MPSYLIKIDTDVTLERKGLDRLEDAVYDVLVNEYGASKEVNDFGEGRTDVETVFN